MPDLTPTPPLTTLSEEEELGGGAVRDFAERKLDGDRIAVDFKVKQKDDVISNSLVFVKKNGAFRVVDAEIYIPHLLHTTTRFVVVRGGLDRIGAFWFGSLVATSMNSRGHVLISYRGGDPPYRILEWDPQRSDASVDHAIWWRGAETLDRRQLP